MVMDEMGGSTVGLIQEAMPRSTETETPASYIPTSVLANYPSMSALLAFVLAQSFKLITSWYKDRCWDLKQLVASGGMPSSHSATVIALAVAVGLQEGFGDPLFATALILACVVMYDATGVRLQAGRQAEVLNQIVRELPSEHPLAESRPLRELLGHTSPQVVAGALLGVSLATIMYLVTRSWSPP
ncbi:unnamed protein product [Fraxinus pennsylvanica]|uniref:Acid phosphatase/vanadium-dependent haloperoxidase-related protein n=1 Tax=Fraxinus pennsylvanica TaxID=56036 RepID=A0AAD1Z206_9LAMI|nr:unnamed protein product [Fraxinus pennsylvanica]